MGRPKCLHHPPSMILVIVHVQRSMSCMKGKVSPGMVEWERCALNTHSQPDGSQSDPGYRAEMKTKVVSNPEETSGASKHPHYLRTHCISAILCQH
ncbi:hypothetical protein PoB_006573700 [Plakobranchus ocellatus]|uniref:Uncharacterized protein n=1 Tax=Plakobranchus ocellatus TaxID=259542 RepID=A0AAV4D500_9GAST|nr:hypothetical protein PoB_006573700 [Plakobranchus ocellatus]